MVGFSLVWQHTSIATAFRSQRQEDHHQDEVSLVYLVHASLGYIVRPISKIKYNCVVYKLKRNCCKPAWTT